MRMKTGCKEDHLNMTPNMTERNMNFENWEQKSCMSIFY